MFYEIQVSLMLSLIKSNLSKFTIVLEPDKNEKDWWAGAPSVVHANNGLFYLTARMRESISPRGRRGYEIKILESQDGIHFREIHQIHRDDTNVPVFERASIVQDPKTNKFRLYGCSSFGEGWGIWKLNDVDHPKDFDPKSLKPVLLANDGKKESSPTGVTDIDSSHHQYVKITGYKDPFIFWENDIESGNIIWHMFVIGYDKVERPYHFICKESTGEQWQPVSNNPVMESMGWHNFFTRPSCILPLEIGYLFVYEGSNLHDFDPVYNISTGLAFTPDLKNYYDLTPDRPLLQSSTPCRYNTWRYSHWLKVEKEIFVYFEACRENQSNEIRLAKIPINHL